MHKPFGFSVLVWLLVGGVAAPSAAMVRNVTGEATFSVGTLPPIQLPAAFSVTVNSSGGTPGGHIAALTLPASPFATTGLVVDVTDPAAAPIEGVLATVHNGMLALAGGNAGPGGLGGLGPFSGVAKLCLFADCTAPVVPANLSVPFNVVGGGGTAFATAFVNVTVIGAAWTSGTANVGTVTFMGFAHGPASVTSSTNANSGVVSLVTPVFISTSIPSAAVVAAFAQIDIHIVPEPGTLLLIGSGVAGLGLAGRSKRRRQRQAALGRSSAREYGK